MKTLTLVVVAVATALSLSACETPTANANTPEKKAAHPGGGGAAYFTGADSAEIAALKARIAVLENAIIVSANDTRFWVNGAETFALENGAGATRGGVMRGQMRVQPASALPTGSRALEVSDAGAFFGDSGFYPGSIMTTARMTSLHLAWNRPIPVFGGYARTVSDVTVGNTDSGGSGYRLLRVPN